MACLTTIACLTTMARLTTAGESLAVEHGDGGVADGVLAPRLASLVPPRQGSRRDEPGRARDAGACSLVITP